MRKHASAFHARTTAAGYLLVPDQRLWWLTRHGHVSAEVGDRLEAPVLRALQLIFGQLGGDQQLLRDKTRGSMDADFLLRDWVVEYDERSHFTSARLATFAYYPDDVALGYDVDEYRRLIGVHRVAAERGFAHKQAAEFPGPAGRMRQRAYFDAFRDLAAPALQGHPVLRVASPEEDPQRGLQRFEACLTHSGLLER